MLPGKKGSILKRVVFLSATIDLLPFERAFKGSLRLIKLPPGFNLNVAMRLVDDRWTSDRWQEDK